MQEGPPLVASDPQHLLADELGRRQALLDGHGQQQRSLAVRPGPQCSSHRGDGNPRSGQPVRLEVGLVPATGLADVQGASAMAHLGAARHRDTDLLRRIVLEAGHHQRGLAVDEGTRSPFEHRHPVATLESQRPRVEAQAVSADRLPALRAHLRPNLAARVAVVVQLPPRDDVCLFGRPLGESASLAQCNVVRGVAGRCRRSVARCGADAAIPKGPSSRPPPTSAEHPSVDE